MAGSDHFPGSSSEVRSWALSEKEGTRSDTTGIHGRFWTAHRRRRPAQLVVALYGVTARWAKHGCISNPEGCNFHHRRIGRWTDRIVSCQGSRSGNHALTRSGNPNSHPARPDSTTTMYVAIPSSSNMSSHSNSASIRMD